MTQTSSYLEHFYTQNAVTNHDDPKKYISIKKKLSSNINAKLYY